MIKRHSAPIPFLTQAHQQAASCFFKMQTVPLSVLIEVFDPFGIGSVQALGMGYVPAGDPWSGVDTRPGGVSIEE